MNDDLRPLLQELDPKARGHLCTVLIRDQSDRDAIASRLIRYRDGNGQRWADVIDLLKVVRLLGETAAESR